MNKNKEELKDISDTDKKGDLIFPLLTMLSASFGGYKPSYSDMELAVLKGKVDVLEKIVLSKHEV